MKTRMATKRVHRRQGRSEARRPLVGVLAPKQELVLPIDPPLRHDEVPVAVTPHAGDILLRNVQPESVTIANSTDRAVLYVVFVAPSIYVKAAMIPWGRIVSDIGLAVRKSGVLARLRRLVKA